MNVMQKILSMKIKNSFINLFRDMISNAIEIYIPVTRNN